MPHTTAKVCSWRTQIADVDLRLAASRTLHKGVNIDPYVQGIVQEGYPDHYIVYTDGSKSTKGLGAADVSVRRNRKLSRAGIASLYTAEVHAIRWAVEIGKEVGASRILICSDSLSALKSLWSIQPRNEMVDKIQQNVHRSIEAGRSVNFLWVPGQSGIPGNDKAVQEAKKVARQAPTFITVPYTDWNGHMRESTYEMWAQKWEESRQPLRSIKQRPGKWEKCTRKEVADRLRANHTKLTHSYLIKGLQYRPVGNWCHNAYITVKRLIIACPGLNNKRREIIKPRIRGGGYGGKSAEWGKKHGSRAGVLQPTKSARPLIAS